MNMEDKNLKDKIIDYCSKHKYVSRQELTKEFTLSYQEAGDIIDDFLKRELLKYDYSNEGKSLRFLEDVPPEKGEDKRDINDIFNSLKEKYEVLNIAVIPDKKEQIYRYKFNVKNILIDDKYIEFTLYKKGDSYYFIDDYKTMNTFNQKYGFIEYEEYLSSEKKESKLDQINKTYNIEDTYDVLQVTFKDKEDALNSFKNLLKAIEEISKLGINTLIEYLKSTKMSKACRKVIRKIGEVDDETQFMDQFGEEFYFDEYKDHYINQILKILKKAEGREDLDDIYTYLTALFELERMDYWNFCIASYLLFETSEEKLQKAFNENIKNGDLELLDILKDDNKTCATIIEDTFKSFNIEVKINEVSGRGFVIRFFIDVKNDIDQDSINKCKEELMKNLNIPDILNIHIDFSPHLIILDIRQYVKYRIFFNRSHITLL